MTQNPRTGTSDARQASQRSGEPRIGEDINLTLVILWLVASCLIGLVWWQALAQLDEGREREIASAKVELANLTRVSQEHADRTLRSADQVIQFVRQRYQAEGAKLNLAQMAAQGVLQMENFNQIGVIDKLGVYILANLPVTGKLDLSDREHFRVHVDSAVDQLFVSKPVMGRASGKWSIQLTRRITQADGSFGGVVVLSIDPSYFSQFYRDLTLGNEGLAALYGMDGVARARRVGDHETHGVDASSAQMFGRLRRGELSGDYIDASKVDGVERMIQFRRLQHYPLVVVAGRELKDVLSNHERAKPLVLLQAGLVSALLVMLSAVLSTYLWRMRSEVRRRLLAERGHRVRTEQLDAVFDLSPDGFVTFDRKGRIAHVSPAFQQMVGQADWLIAGLDEPLFLERFNAFCKSDSQLGLPALTAGGLALQSRRDHRQVVALRGAPGRVLQVVSRVSDSSSVSRILYFRDITRETEVDRVKTEFLSTAAHELRTPMASIYGFAEVLLTSECEEESRQEFLEIILHQSQNIARILDDLLDLSRMEARRGVDFKVARVDLRDLVRTLVRGFKPPIGREPPTLECSAAPVMVLVDPSKVEQAILNVVSNAYKYSFSNAPVAISVGTSEREGRTAGRVVVVDHGIGMTPEQAARAFDRFFRADQSGSTPGTGLGLSIVKEIVELHGGAVTLASREGAGTTVEIVLPGNHRSPAPPAAPRPAADA